MKHHIEVPQEPIGLVIFGVTGDLTRRKLIPALYQLEQQGNLPEKLGIIGFARREWDDEVMRETLKNGVREFARNQPVDEDVLERLAQRMVYVRSSFDVLDGYQRLDKKPVSYTHLTLPTN